MYCGKYSEERNQAKKHSEEIAKGELNMGKNKLYMEKMEANLTQYNARLLEMRGKAAEIQVDMKLEYLSQVESLEKKRDELKAKHEQLKKAGEHAWEDVKGGTEKAWNELKESVDKATNRFK